MDAHHAQRLEGIVNVSASAILAAAVAVVAPSFAFSPAAATAVSAAVFLGGWKLLSTVGGGSPDFNLVQFEPRPLPELVELEELMLTDADRVVPVSPAEREETEDTLVLDDVLARLDEGSRVVCLFDASAMPTPAQLKSRIDRHLDSGGFRGSPPDASRELHDALDELRKSLR